MTGLTVFKKSGLAMESMVIPFEAPPAPGAAPPWPLAPLPLGAAGAGAGALGAAATEIGVAVLHCTKGGHSAIFRRGSACHKPSYHPANHRVDFARVRSQSMGPPDHVSFMPTRSSMLLGKQYNFSRYWIIGNLRVLLHQAWLPKSCVTSWSECGISATVQYTILPLSDHQRSLTSSVDAANPSKIFQLSICARLWGANPGNWNFS
jgi:hypothetical protein